MSSTIGSEKTVWRYDPIFISEKYNLNSHIENFEKIVASLSGYTGECIISFVDLYEKTKRNFNGVREVSKEEREIIGREFVAIGNKNNIKIKICAEGYELAKFGVNCSGCLYCYANYSKDIVRDNFRKHNKNSPFLIGDSMEGDIVKEAIQHSYIDNQISFF